jgi:hypothetical protein
MTLFRKIKSFSGTTNQVKLLFFKAYILSGLVKLTLVFLPFSKVLKWQGEINIESPECPDQFSAEFRKSLQSAMRLCRKYTIWETECYTQALTAKILLNKKRISGTVYIGFKKEDTGSYMGHAWLRSFDRFITGYEEKNAYTVHSFYS